MDFESAPRWRCGLEMGLPRREVFDGSPYAALIEVNSIERKEYHCGAGWSRGDDCLEVMLSDALKTSVCFVRTEAPVIWSQTKCTHFQSGRPSAGRIGNPPYVMLARRGDGVQQRIRFLSRNPVCWFVLLVESYSVKPALSAQALRHGGSAC